MDLKQMLKQIKDTEKEKGKNLSRNIEQDKLQKKENLDEIKNQNLQLKSETKTNQSITRNIHYL
jgi:hypothetical protein